MDTQIKPATFKDWMLETFDKDDLDGIANHGADCGWAGLTYTADAAELFDDYADELWDTIQENAQDFGYKNPLEFIASWNRANMAEGNFASFKNLLVWYAAEYWAYRLLEDDEESNSEGEG